MTDNWFDLQIARCQKEKENAMPYDVQLWTMAIETYTHQKHCTKRHSRSLMADPSQVCKWPNE